jgi:glucose/arabinose dehydrogenase
MSLVRLGPGSVPDTAVGVAVAQDGSLLVTDDGSQSIWRDSYAREVTK